MLDSIHGAIGNIYYVLGALVALTVLLGIAMRWMKTNVSKPIQTIVGVRGFGAAGTDQEWLAKPLEARLVEAMRVESIIRADADANQAKLVELRLGDQANLIESKLDSQATLVKSRLDDQATLVESRLGDQARIIESRLSDQQRLTGSQLRSLDIKVSTIVKELYPNGGESFRDRVELVIADKEKQS
jgi:hypothetical protein